MQKALIAIAFACLTLLAIQTPAEAVVGKDCADNRFRRMVMNEVNELLDRDDEKYELIDLTDSRTLKFNSNPVDIVCSYYFKFSDGDAGRFIVKVYLNSLGDEIIEYRGE